MNEAREQIGINAAKSRTCTVLHLPVSVFLIYNEKAIHSQHHAYLVVTLNHGMKMFARGKKRGKTCFFSLFTFSTIAHSRWEQKWHEEIWGFFFLPKSKVSLSENGAVLGVMQQYIFCRNPIKDLSLFIIWETSPLYAVLCYHKYWYMRPNWPNKAAISTEYLPVNCLCRLSYIFHKEVKVRVKVSYYAFDVDMLEDLTVIRLQSEGRTVQRRRVGGGWVRLMCMERLKAFLVWLIGLLRSDRMEDCRFNPQLLGYVCPRSFLHHSFFFLSSSLLLSVLFAPAFSCMHMLYWKFPSLAKPPLLIHSLLFFLAPSCRPITSAMQWNSVRFFSGPLPPLQSVFIWPYHIWWDR